LPARWKSWGSSRDRGRYLAGNLLNPYGPGGSGQSLNGEMIVGSGNGVTAFYPDRVADTPYVPPVALTDLLLFNEPVLARRRLTAPQVDSGV